VESDGSTIWEDAARRIVDTHQRMIAMRTFAFLTAILLPLFLVDSIQAAIPLTGSPKYAAAVLVAALLMSGAVWIDSQIQRRSIGRDLR
jgi:hypothetical protein